MLITELRLGQSIEVGEALLKLVRVEGNKVKIAIDAPQTVAVKYEKRRPLDGDLTGNLQE